MRNSILFILLFTFSLATGQNSQEAYVFENVNVLPMHGTAPVLMRENRSVVIENGKITQVAAAAEVDVPAGAIVIDGSGKYLIPGISEMHAHIPVPQDGDDSNVRETLFLYLSNGITTIRGMLGNPYHLELREKVAKGEILGPRIYTSSPSLNGNTVQSKEEAKAKVTRYAAAGYDFLKIHPGIQLDVFEQIVKTARRKKISFAGHVPTAVGIQRALDFRYASIDHLDGYVDGLVPESAGVHPDSGGLFGFDFTQLAEPELIPALVAKTKKKKVWIVPTQSLLVRWTADKSGAAMANEPEMIYVPGATRFQWRQMKDGIISNPNYSADKAEAFIHLRQQLLKEMHNQNVGLLLGSDAPQVFNVPGFSIQHEMQSWAEAGIPSHAILKAGTMNVARFFDAEGEYGSIQPGAAADLILLSANPIENIFNMQQIEGVMVKGQWLPRAEIDRRLQGIAGKYK